MRKSFTKKERQMVWKKYQMRCAYCGCLLEYKDMQVDHIIPYKRKFDMEMGRVYDNDYQNILDYGINDYKNLNPACRVCNKWKSTLSIEEFKHEIQMQVSRLNKKSASYRMALKYCLIKQTLIKVTFHFEIIEMIK